MSPDDDFAAPAEGGGEDQDALAAEWAAALAESGAAAPAVAEEVQSAPEQVAPAAFSTFHSSRAASIWLWSWPSKRKMARS